MCVVSRVGCFSGEGQRWALCTGSAGMQQGGGCRLGQGGAEAPPGRRPAFIRLARGEGMQGEGLGLARAKCPRSASAPRPPRPAAPPGGAGGAGGRGGGQEARRLFYSALARVREGGGRAWRGPLRRLAGPRQEKVKGGEERVGEARVVRGGGAFVCAKARARERARSRRAGKQEGIRRNPEPLLASKRPPVRGGVARRG